MPIRYIKIVTMANELITSFEDFAVDSFTYGDPKTNAKGGKSIKIYDTRKNTLTLSTPLLLTWGINKMVDDATGRVSYSLSLQFPNDQYGDDDTNMFFDQMKEFQERIITDAVANSKAWFGKSKLSREVAEALMYPILKYPKDKTSGEPDYSRAPTMNLKIPYWEGKWDVELYDVDERPIFNDQTDMTGKIFEKLIPKASHLIPVIQCNGIWFAAGKFGVTWKLVQAIVRPPLRIKGQCFVKMSSKDKSKIQDIEEREEAQQTAAAEVEEELTAQHSTAVEDSDEEPEPEPAPEPAKKPKRKVIRKKVVKST